MSRRQPHVAFIASAAEDYGADRMLLQSVRALRPAHRVTVILPVDGPLRSRLEAEGASVRVLADYALRRKYLSPLRIPGLLARNVRSAARLRALHRRDPIDLVVTNTEAVLLGGLLAWVIGRPHLWHVHEIVDRPATFARLMAWTIHRSTDRVVACSPAVREHLLRLQPALASRTTVVANAIPLPERPAIPCSTTGALRVGCIGRIHPRKGQDQLAAAWIMATDHLDSLSRPLELHFFGAPLPGQGHLVQQIQDRLDAAGCGPHVTFHGFVGDPDEVYRDLDLVVVPSVEPESFSLVCAEAQGYGIPVIGPDQGGPAQTVQNEVTGLLVDPRDVDALAAALTRLLGDDDERRTFGVAGRAWAERAFSLDRYHQEIRDVVTATILGTSPGSDGRPPATPSRTRSPLVGARR